MKSGRKFRTMRILWNIAAVNIASVSDPDRTAVELVNRVPRSTDQTKDLAERPKGYRRVRIPFKATCAVTETDSSRMVVA